MIMRRKTGKRALILANGNPPSRELLRMARRHADVFVCADGGANAAARMHERPDLIIGDMDSVTSATMRSFRSVRTIRIASQNSTDLEKALAWVLKRGIRFIDVTGALGGRTDHMLGNLSALAKAANDAAVRFVDMESVLIPVGSRVTFEAPPGMTVSLLPLSRCEGITTVGLRWGLRNDTLELGVRDGTSNRVTSSPVSIRVRRGRLLAYLVMDARTLFPGDDARNSSQ